MKIKNFQITKNEIEFDQRFSSPKACYDYLFKQKWPNGFICKKCGLYASREQISDIRDRLNQREVTREDKQYDYLEWWQKSKKEKRQI